MKNKLGAAPVLLILLYCLPAKGQERDYSSLKTDSIIQEFDSLFNSDDSLSIFRLIDSLIQMPDVKETSQLAVRIGYNSNVVATSRTVGFNQFGLAPGIAYYHKSGLYADATGYWSKEYTPDYYLTVLSGGYLKTATKHWSFLAEYSHYFYTDTGSGTYTPYTNNIGVSNYLDLKPVTLRLDYYLYFGDKTAHRIMPGINFTLQKKKWLGFDRITFFPGFNVMLGSESVIDDYRFYPDLKQRIRKNRTLPDNAKLPLYYTVEKNVFGVMNYSFTAPLSFTLKNWNLLVSYTYNIPKALPGEDLSLQNGGYLSFSVSHYLSFKSE